MRQTHAAAMEYDLFLQRLYIATGLFSLIALCFLTYVTM
jgi:hypothetical protein